jgi:hypothetical protein
LTSKVSKITVDEYRAYSKALDEITYNLQESQDFFDASLDGRLKNYHQLEKCMIEAQLQVRSLISLPTQLLLSSQ